jgi:hypothetical protein
LARNSQRADAAWTLVATRESEAVTKAKQTTAVLNFFMVDPVRVARDVNN